MAEKFTQKFVDNAADGLYTDASERGLVLRVRNGGKHKSWYFRRMINSKRYEVGLGGTASVSLSQAKVAAARLRLLPAAEFEEQVASKKSKKLVPEKKKTFREVSEEYMAWNVEVGNWEDWSKSHRVFESRMRCHVWPLIGDLLFEVVEPKDVAAIAVKQWDHPDIVDRCLQFTKSVFDWGKAKGYSTRDNPADRRGALKFLLPNTKHVKQNRGALAVEDLPAFFAASLAESQSSSRACFEFSVLTATRSMTARLARWEQIDWENRLWTIPPEQLKVSGNGALIVPLAPEVIRFLESWGKKEEGLIFPNGNGKPLSDAILGRIVKITPGDWYDKAESLKRGVRVRPTQHGIARATFRTWSQDDALGNDLRFDARTAELCLHHKVPDAYNGAYERNSSMIRRREMMEAWAKFCFSKAGTFAAQSSD